VARLESGEDGTAEKSQIEQGILFTAGVLGHYVADSANPHHTTIHHNGWDTSFAPNPKGYTTAEAERAKRPDGFHHRFESEFVESKISAADVRPLLTPLSPVSRVFDDTVAFLKASNSQVDRLYALEKANAFRTSGEADPEGLRFARERMAAGASRLRDIWAASMQGTAPYQRNRSRTPAASTAAPNAPTAGATLSAGSGQPAGK